MRKATEYTLGIFKLSDGEKIVGFSSDLNIVEDFLNTGNYPYTFRNLSCDAKTHSVCGVFQDETGRGAGVLEWCWDLEDAEILKSLMERDSRFSELEIVEEKSEEKTESEFPDLCIPNEV